MRDGLTQKLDRPAPSGSIRGFQERYAAKLVLITSDDAGREFPIVNERVSLGRGPGVDLAFDDPAMSRQHAAVEYSGQGFRVRDLGSTNGMLVNSRGVQASDLKHGDEIEIGGLRFRFVIEEHEVEPEVYELPSE